MKKSILLLTLLFSSFTYSQVGIGTDQPQATLEVVANTSNSTTFDGIIAPKVTGDFLKTKTYTTNQTGAIVYVTSPYTDTNTTQTINVTSTGYYYFDGIVWSKIIDNKSLPAGPWLVQGSDIPATKNTDNIYQMGNIAINKKKSKDGVDLDVSGSIRGGFSGRAMFPGTTPDPIGLGSFAFGNLSEATQFGSIALGTFAKSTAGSAIAIGSSLGSGTIASGEYSVAIGVDSKAIAAESVAIGISANSKGKNSLAMGSYTSAPSKNEMTLGKYNAILTGNPTEDVDTDALLQLGNGEFTEFNNDNKNGKNALTILKNGNVGIGIDGQNEVAKPTVRLDIGSGDVKIRSINSTTGSATDRIVVADANGVLKTIPNTSPKTTNVIANQIITTIPNYNIETNSLGIHHTDLYTAYANYLNSENTQSTIVKSAGAPNLAPQYDRNSLYYYVTNYDKNAINNITIDANGILNYNVTDNSIKNSKIYISFVPR